MLYCTVIDVLILWVLYNMRSEQMQCTPVVVLLRTYHTAKCYQTCHNSLNCDSKTKKWKGKTKQLVTKKQILYNTIKLYKWQWILRFIHYSQCGNISNVPMFRMHSNYNLDWNCIDWYQVWLQWTFHYSMFDKLSHHCICFVSNKWKA